MKEHSWEYSEADDPASMRLRVGIRCRGCGSYAATHVPLPPRHAVVARVRALLRKSVSRLSPDCDEAARLGVVSEVMES